MEPIDESRVVFQIAIELTDAGPRVSLRSGINLPLERAGYVYGAALSSTLEAVVRAAEHMTDDHKAIFYAGVEAAIEAKGHSLYLKSLVHVKEKKPNDEPDAPADTGPAAG